MPLLRFCFYPAAHNGRLGEGVAGGCHVLKGDVICCGREWARGPLRYVFFFFLLSYGPGSLNK